MKRNIKEQDAWIKEHFKERFANRIERNRFIRSMLISFGIGITLYLTLVITLANIFL